MLPFVHLSGTWHVITNWVPGLEAGQNLHLRALSKEEAEWLEDQLEDSFHETFARLFPNDEAVINGSIPPDDD